MFKIKIKFFIYVRFFIIFMPYNRNADGKLIRKSMGVSDVFEKIRSENVKFIDLQFTDVPGKLHHVTVPTHTINDNSFSVGVPKLDGSSI